MSQAYYLLRQQRRKSKLFQNQNSTMHFLRLGSNRNRKSFFPSGGGSKASIFSEQSTDHACEHVIGQYISDTARPRALYNSNQDGDMHIRPRQIWIMKTILTGSPANCSRLLGFRCRPLWRPPHNMTRFQNRFQSQTFSGHFSMVPGVSNVSLTKPNTPLTSPSSVSGNTEKCVMTMRFPFSFLLANSK